jgi:hypothetical protein
MTIPPLPKFTDVRQPGERGFSFGGSAWFASPKPFIVKGSAVNNYPGDTQLLGTPKLDQGFELSMALGSHNAVRVSYFGSQASGGSAIPSQLQLWDQYYSAGVFVATNYHLKNLKLSLEYLTWPYPAKESRFRLKTLWQAQYTSIYSGFDAPYEPTTDALGNYLTDANGNALTYRTQGVDHFILPSVGVEVQEWVRPHFRLEASASGFDLPHRANTWDADASANIRFLHYELRLGVRGYHFRTSPTQQYWFHSTTVGPFIGLRVYSD